MLTGIQSIYKLVFNTTYLLTKHIDERIREIIVSICLFILAGQFFYKCAAEFIGLPSVTMRGLNIMGYIVITILCIFSVNNKLQKVYWNPWICYPYFLSALIMILTGFHHDTGKYFNDYAWMMFIVFPAIYFIWNNRGDYERYFKILAKSIVIQGALVIVLTYILRPINTITVVSGRYSGLTDNPNILGMVGLVVTLATLYLIVTEKKKLPVYIIINSIFVAMVWMSVSRTALMALALQIVFWVIMTFRIEFMREKTRTLILVGLVILAMVVAIPVVRGSLDFVGQSVTPIAKAAPAGTDGIANPESRLEFNGKTAAELSSGRDYIWKQYVKKFNLLGNKYNFYVTLPSGQKIRDAHNTYINIAFRAGVPAGAIYLIFMTVVFAFTNMNVFNNKRRKHMIFVALAVAAYFVETVFERQVEPFYAGTVLMFFLSLGPLFAFNPRENTDYSLEDSETI